MAAVLFYHVVGDLTVGKPELVEFPESASVAEAIVTIRDCTECGIPVWKQRPPEKSTSPESAESRQDRFVGILNALDIVAHLSTEWGLTDPEAALKTPVSQIVLPNASLLRQVAPGTRLVDALEILKQGVRRLLVRRTVGWKGMSKRFSVLYNGKWLNPLTEADDMAEEKWCCLAREDVIRFLIGCLGALAPLPLTSIESLGAVTRHYFSLDSRAPAREAVRVLGNDPPAIAVVEHNDGQDEGVRIIGDISAFKLWKTDHVSAAWALANLTAGEFVMGVEDIVPLSACSSRDALIKLADHGTGAQSTKPNTSLKLGPSGTGLRIADGSRRKSNPLSTVKEERSGSITTKGPARKFSTRSLDFVNLYFDNGASDKCSSPRPYRGRSAPLTCRPSNSLAAVMAQMLAHRATHVWVTEQRDDGEYEKLVGIVTYADILTAVTRPPTLPPLSN